MLFQLNRFNWVQRGLLLQLLFVGFFYTTGFGQIQLNGIVYDSATKMPIIGATIHEPLSGTGCISDSIGRFSLVIQEFPVKIEVSHLSYSKSINIIVNNEFIEILLSFKSYDLEEAVIFGELYERISNRSDFNLLNYEVLEGKAILVGFANSLNYGMLKVIDLNTRKTLLKTSVNKPLEVIKDYIGNIHLITKDSMYQLFIPDSIYFLYGCKNNTKNKELFSLIGTINNFTIQKKTNTNGQYFEVLAINNITYKSQIIYKAFDSDLFQTARQASSYRMWLFKGRGKVSGDPGVANEMFESYSYDKHVKYRRKHLHVEVLNDNIIIFDPNSWKLVIINSQFDIVNTIDIPFNSSGLNRTGINIDEQTGKVYLYNSNWGSTTIYLLNIDSSQITRIADFDGFSNIRNPIVYNNKVYFMYIEKTYPQVNSLFSKKLIVN